MIRSDNQSGLRRDLRATYRLQFNRDFTLRQAIELVPYLRRLGISHIYASPLLKACAGSTHGYDVCDCSQLSPEIGTEADLESLITTLHANGMGLVLDIVPNHMAASEENPWWWDILKHGRASRYANYFDIQWDASDPSLQGKILLPVLGDHYEQVLKRNELSVQITNGQPSLCYFDHRFPLSPDSIQEGTTQLAGLNGRPDALDALIQKQHYQLVCWRLGDTRVNYRRFFNVSSLAGIRIEDPQVFKDTHTRILDWYELGWIDGLRIDHPDGLSDPQEYLERLQKAMPKAWIVVEKILEPNETLSEGWPVAGTTGYDFLNQAGGLLIDTTSEEAFTNFYKNFTGEPVAYEALVGKKKRWVLDHLLRAEMDRLLRLLLTIVATHAPDTNTANDLHASLVALIASLPVYRTYIQPGSNGLSPQDKQWLHNAVEHASHLLSRPKPALLAFLLDILQLKLVGDLETEFVMRFQQLTGPVMAKGVEDTLFYCFNRFIALNEVGGDPGRFGMTITEFHQTCSYRGQHWPHAMLATSTHDTKRSEDVRTRLAALSEIPAQWAAAVNRWSALNEKHRGTERLDRNAEYLFYQTLVGAWPLSVDRAVAFMAKASREAKQYTSWANQNTVYDETLKQFVTATMRDDVFMSDVEAFVTQLVEAGQVNSLAQTLVKLTAPGIPDIYQGTELWDLSLVDPDNRRPVDYSQRRRLLAELESLTLEQIWQRRNEGKPKLWLIRQVLQFRRRQPDWFNAGSIYRPLMPHGDKSAHLVAYARGASVIVAVPRLSIRLARDWSNTTLLLPEGAWINEITSETVNGGERQVAELFKRFPVALLSRKKDH